MNMNKKLIGILVCLLFFGVSVIPSISGDNGIINSNRDDLDQSQTERDGGSYCFSNLHNPQAQSFKPLSTSLTRVELFFDKGGYPSFTIKVSIRNSLTGDDLTSKTMHVSQIPSD